ncbi:hypothetical protein [Paracoccus tibetensis]|uniref:Uncharacterized protein n=1 Tax=Paracoccus tibetensis TaxID=336292 RepID=A0A1G5IYN1_9RHOB|nr:hypothetical protein [Paracoccus tibetensis]SCY80801.1 hypothetical protein SAMN05660710_02851 [Paracoccus tibetensis]
MSTWRCFVFGLFAALSTSPEPSYTQSEHPRPTLNLDYSARAKGRAGAVADRVEAVFLNASMISDYLRQNQIKDRLESYLKEIGARPKFGEVHVFYVQATMNGQGAITEVKDFQYLTYGKTTVDAIRESFALDGAPGEQPTIYSLNSETKIVGIYVSAYPGSNGFTITGGPLTPRFYHRIRSEGLALRDERDKKRAEAKRIGEKLEQLRAAHRSSHQQAIENIARDRRGSPLPSGPALSSSGLLDADSQIYLPPTQTGTARGMNITPRPLSRAAHPPVRFDRAPAPPVEMHHRD